MIIRKTLRILLFLLNLLLIGCMFVGKASAWINPEQSTLPTIFGLFFPYLAIINCVFIIYWLWLRKWQAIIPVLAMLLFWSELQASFSFFKTSAPVPNATEIKVMTYNVAYFGFFKKNSSALDYIARSGADIVCLQEFGYYKESDQYFATDDIEDKLSPIYPYRSLHLSERAGGRMLGMAIYSKYPIINEEAFLKQTLIHLPLSRRMHADIKIGNDTLRVFNAYLKSNSLNKHDKNALFEMADKLEASALDSVASNVFLKIGRAAQIRNIQAEHLASKIAESPYPVVVCGDFNDTPVSYTYNTIGKDLNDSFVGSGAGMGITYNEHLIRVKIDYLLHSKEITSSDYHIEKVKYSDHYPVKTSLWLKNN